MRVTTKLLSFAVLAVVAVATLALTACTDDNGDDAVAESPVPVGTPDVLPPELPGGGEGGGDDARGSCDADEAISWTEAVNHVGRDVSLIGPVFSVEPSGDTVTIVVGSGEVEESRRLDIVLTKNALSGIGGDATNLFEDEQVCVVGVVQAATGNLQIVVNEADDIRVL